VEGLFARLLASGRIDALCALSAVVENGEQLAGWLGVQLIEGTAEDRPVPLKLDHKVADALDKALTQVLEPCLRGQQAIVFCSSRAGAEVRARHLAEHVEPHLAEENREALQALSDRLREDDPLIERVVDLLPSGVAYHHAGLPKTVRHEIERSFRSGNLRVIASTPTLAAGVNLPADIAVVRDVFRTEVVRGVHRRVLLPSSEILNMLGRAGRPGRSRGGDGRGIALVEKKWRDDPDIKSLLAAVKKGRGGKVESRIPDSFDAVMRFVLGVIVERGEATRDDVAATFVRTLCHHCATGTLDFARPFKEDMMEDLPEYQKVVAAKGKLCLGDCHLSPAGIHATIKSNGKRYAVTITLTGVTCDCPAASRYFRNRVCKHQACAIHDLLFAEGIEEEARARAIYACSHIFGKTLETGTRLNTALDILEQWRLIERVPTGYRATPVGTVAAMATFDLLLVRQAMERVRAAVQATYREFALWSVVDFHDVEKNRERWSRSVEQWITEIDRKKIKLPTKYRGDFEQGLEDLARVCRLFEQAAIALGRQGLAREARTASHSLRYGVKPELVPLMALGFPQLRRARCRYLFAQGIQNVADLALADPLTIAHPRRAPEVLVREWVERAKEIQNARAIETADHVEADAEFDELVARFRLDPAALMD
jgi:helicase